MSGKNSFWNAYSADLGQKKFKVEEVESGFLGIKASFWISALSIPAMVLGFVALATGVVAFSTAVSGAGLAVSTCGLAVGSAIGGIALLVGGFFGLNSVVESEPESPDVDLSCDFF